jgi:hypothetical protein
MKELLEIIIKDCLAEGIKVHSELAEDNSIAYRVDGFSKSGDALLYVEENAVVCKTRYDRIDHILTFRDLAYVAYDWYNNYKDREPFQKPDPNWENVFLNLRFGYKNTPDYDDLPF